MTDRQDRMEALGKGELSASPRSGPERAATGERCLIAGREEGFNRRGGKNKPVAQEMALGNRFTSLFQDPCGRFEAGLNDYIVVVVGVRAAFVCRFFVDRLAVDFLADFFAPRALGDFFAAVFLLAAFFLVDFLAGFFAAFFVAI